MSKEDLLESIADDFLGSIRAGKTPPSPSYYVQKCPALEQEIRSLLTSLRKLENFSQQETKRRKSTQTLTSPAPNTLGEFEIVREIGRGGMGTVYLAADRLLDRRVALKVLAIPEEPSDKDGQKSDRAERFQREARLASRLHHTNIVPVFGVGQEQNHLYYAMQFIDGVDLRKILRALGEQRQPLELSASLVDQARRLIAFDLDPDEFAGSADDTEILSSESSSPSSDSLNSDSSSLGSLASETSGTSTRKNRRYWESVARIGIQICDALHYAHSNEVVHRDIKPSNLIMDRAGAVWVTDFGLAKIDEESDLTKTGDVLGTLRYMAPEQLEGKDDPSSDLYSLGLTLYELLTLAPAHQSTNFQKLVEEKTTGRQKAPRKIDPNIPRDLETIVLKAIQSEPGKRYRSARAMQEDLQNFLIDRPISARRTTVVERGLRWCRRNKSLAALLCLLAILPIALPIGLGIAYQREATQREKAEERLHIALDGLDQIFSSFVQPDAISATYVERIASEGSSMRLSPETGKFLEKMLVFYDRLSTDDVELSPRLNLESARAFRRVGDIYQALGQYSNALSAYTRAQERYQGLEASAENRIRLAELDLEKGRIYQVQREGERADLSFTNAHDRLSAISGQESKLLLAQTYLLRGREGPNLRPEPPTPLRLESFFDMRGPGPDRRGPPHEQFDRDREDGRFRRPPPRRRTSNEEKDNELAIQNLRNCISILDELLGEKPDSPQLRYLRALALREMGKPSIFKLEPESERAKAANVLKELVSEFPSNPDFQFELSQTYRDIDAHRIGQNDASDAITQLHEARTLSESLVKQHDQVAIYRINLAHIYANLGMLYEDLRKHKDAEQYTRKAINAHRYVADHFPGLEASSRSLLAGPSFALVRLLLSQERVLESYVILGDLERSLLDQINDKTVDTSLRDKAKIELENCNQLLVEVERIYQGDR